MRFAPSSMRPYTDTAHPSRKKVSGSRVISGRSCAGTRTIPNVFAGMTTSMLIEQWVIVNDVDLYSLSLTNELVAPYDQPAEGNHFRQVFFSEAIFWGRSVRSCLALPRR